MNKKNFKGFTLIELLIVIAVRAVLSSLVFVALNPLARFQDSRNTKRWTDVNSILSAIKLNQIDNGGTYFEDVDELTAGLYYQIGNEDSCAQACSYPTIVLQSDCVDLEGLVDEGYMPSVPVDPNDSGSDESHTGYFLVKSATGSITVGACHEEAGSSESPNPISVVR